MGAATLVVVAALGWFVHLQTRTRTLRVAAGTRSGEGRVFADALAVVVKAHAPRLVLEPVETKGSAENVELLESGNVELAIAQNDVRTSPTARTVAFLYPQLFHLVAKSDGPVRSVADLRGRRIGTPPEGGGSHSSFLALLSHYRIAPKDLTVSPMKSDDLARAFQRGELDAMFRVDRIGDSGVSGVLEGGHGRLVPIDQAAAMRLRLPYLDGLVIPRGAYSANPPVPEEELPTVGVHTALLAHTDLDAELVRQVAELLFDHRMELVAATPAAAHVSAPPPDSLSMGLHDGARAYYDREKPGFLVLYAEVIALLMTLGGMGLSVLVALRSRLTSGRKEQADRHHLDLVSLVEQIETATDPTVLASIRAQLLAVFRRLVEDLDQDRMTTDSFQAFAFTFETAMTALERRERQLSREALR